jgi:hypothetical protein
MGKAEVVEAFDKQPDEKEIVATRQAEAEEIIEAFADFEIEDDDDYDVVADGLKEVKTIAKDLESRRKKITQPINGALREFNSWFKPAQLVLTNTERALKKKLADYTIAKEEQSRLAMEAAAQASQDGDFDGAHEAAKGIVESPSAQGITHSRYYDYEIVDMDEVPRRYMCVDHSAVKIHIKNAGKTQPEDIPGIRFTEKTRVIARTK